MRHCQVLPVDGARHDSGEGAPRGAHLGQQVPIGITSIKVFQKVKDIVCVEVNSESLAQWTIDGLK